jgi:hypothetical protein
MCQVFLAHEYGCWSPTWYDQAMTNYGIPHEAHKLHNHPDDTEIQGIFMTGVKTKAALQALKRDC